MHANEISLQNDNEIVHFRDVIVLFPKQHARQRAMQAQSPPPVAAMVPIDTTSGQGAADFGAETDGGNLYASLVVVFAMRFGVVHSLTRPALTQTDICPTAGQWSRRPQLLPHSVVPPSTRN
jgi:hypothetical protein